MKRNRLPGLGIVRMLVVALGIAASALPALAGAAAAAPLTGDAWVCPPCGCGGDEREHAEPGTCPLCGMTLVPQGEAQGPTQRPRAAILVFDGVQIIDYTGPYEVLGQGGFDVYTVARSRQPVVTAMGMSVNPSHDFGSAPQPNVLVVPGGSIHAAESPETLEWIRQTADSAEYVLSVCNGAFLLARVGLLDGKAATTFYPLLDELRQAAPDTRVIADERFVDNGKVITSAGLSSGIDAAFHVLERTLGRGAAQRIALHLEYDWDPESRFARGALPDRLVPRLERELEGSWTLVETSGDRDRWQTRWSVNQAGSPGDLRRAVGMYLSGKAGWARQGGMPGRTEWRFEDGGARWNALVQVGALDSQTGALGVSIAIERQKR